MHNSDVDNNSKIKKYVLHTSTDMAMAPVHHNGRNKNSKAANHWNKPGTKYSDKIMQVRSKYTYQKLRKTTPVIEDGKCPYRLRPVPPLKHLRERHALGAHARS